MKKNTKLAIIIISSLVVGVITTTAYTSKINNKKIENNDIAFIEDIIRKSRSLININGDVEIIDIQDFENLKVVGFLENEKLGAITFVKEDDKYSMKNIEVKDLKDVEDNKLKYSNSINNLIVSIAESFNKK